MFTNRLKAQLTDGRPAINGWLSIGNPFTAEIVAAQGYDSVTIDAQHGALDYTAVLPMLQAMRASGVTPMVRVPWREPGAIMKALDAGAQGIICPMVNSAAEVAEGVANLDAIAATPGLDGIYIGPADLTLGTQAGRLAPAFDREEPEMIELIKHILEVCKRNGIRACIHCGTASYAARAIEWGFDLTTVSGDSRLLAAAAAGSVAEWRSLTKAPAPVAASLKGTY